MDLIALLQHVPQLLEACIEDSTAAVRIMRLVSKEASMCSMLALKTYVLKLTGNSRDTNVSGARLLRQTHLTRLNVHLRLSSSYSPELMLEMFVRQAGGPCLNTVTQLYIDFQREIKSAAAESALDEAMMLLMAACPNLERLRCFEDMSLVLGKRLGQVCPLLSSLVMSGGYERHQDQQQTAVYMLQSLLPQLTNLALYDRMEELPDMSKNKGILHLELPSNSFEQERYWLNLPPNLQSLVCSDLHVGPPAYVGQKVTLGCLLSLDFEYAGSMELQGLIKLLRAAPSLCTIRNRFCSGTDVPINCRVNANMAGDLCILRDLETNVLKDSMLCFDLHEENRTGFDIPVLLASLPRMPHSNKCKFRSLQMGDLGQLIKLFPDLQQLTLRSCEDLNSIELQVLMVCTQLTTLELKCIHRVSQNGLLLLCERLPRLCTIRCIECAQLQLPFVESFAQLLGRDISIKECHFQRDVDYESDEFD